MAETADIVNHGRKIVILPDSTAGCPMADSAKNEDVRKVWGYITKAVGEQKIRVIVFAPTRP